MGAHPKHSPSSLPAKALCPWWASDPMPGPQALRGTSVHGFLAGYCADRKLPAGVPVDQAEAVLWGIAQQEELRQQWPEHAWRAEVQVEIHGEDCRGTIDLLGMPTDGWSDTAIVVDWKTGRGEREDAGRNLQLIAYAYGAMRLNAAIKRVIVMVAECDHQTISVCQWNASQLSAAMVEIAEVIRRAESATENDANPSEKACQYCLRRNGCRALAATVEQTAAQLPALPPVEQLPADQVGPLLDKYLPLCALVEKFKKGLESRAKDLIAAGETIPGWRLGDHAGSRDWTIPEDQVSAAVTRYFDTKGAIAPPLHELASPAEVERRMVEQLGRARGVKSEVQDVLRGISKSKSSKTLIREGSKV